MNLFSGLVWRLIRTAAGLGLASAVAWVTKDPKWIWLAPIITAIAKAARDKFNLQNIPL